MLIDKTDEYQLISFITRFKSSFFISYGLIKLIIQYVQYYRCVIFDTTSVGMECRKNGPGAQMFIYPEAAMLAG